MTNEIQSCGCEREPHECESEEDIEIERLRAEVLRLRKENEDISNKSMQDFYEYKRRRNDQFAAYELAHWATIAFLLDRAEQYDNSSGYRAFIDELVESIAERRHINCAEAGEYDDMKARVDRIVSRTKETSHGHR